MSNQSGSTRRNQQQTKLHRGANAGSAFSVERLESRMLLSAGTSQQQLNIVTDPLLPADDGASSLIGSTPAAVAGPVASFQWNAISTPQQSGAPFGATITAKDAGGNVATGFNGAAVLTALSTTVATPAQTMLGDVAPDTTVFVFSRTLGYSFTPNTDISVTHVRSYFGSKVSIWTDDGTLLRSVPVTAPGGVWTETPLGTPLRLKAGVTYRIGAYNGGHQYFGRKDLPNDNSIGHINQAFFSVDDAMPSVPDNVSWWLVDLKGDKLVTNSVPVTPSVAVFTSGVWTGNVTINTLSPELMLRANDGAGHLADSNTFVVVPGAPASYTWSAISTPQQSGIPFGATLTARDVNGNLSTGFNGSVSLSGQSRTVAAAAQVMLGDVVPDTTVFVLSRTLGYSFTPSSDINVTHLRSYFGSKVSIWTDDGTLLASVNVTAPNGTWTETALGSPLRLSAGVTYRIGAYNGGRQYFGRKGLPSQNSLGTINEAFYSVGDAVPTVADNVDWWLVDLKGDKLAVNTIPVSPSVATFTGGTWSGNITVNPLASDLVLRADDGVGHINDSNSFVVIPGPAASFQWSAIGSPQVSGTPFGATLTAHDSNGHVATGFNGSLSLSGLDTSVANPAQNMLGDVAPDTVVFVYSRTLGYSFTPSSDLNVTDVRSYFGTKVSIWTNDGTLLASVGVSAPGGSWTETPLGAPLRLHAGVTYRLGAYNGGRQYFGKKGLPSVNTIGTINQALFSVGDAVPATADNVDWWLVDLKADVLVTNPASVTPSTANFTNGIWTGNVTVNQTSAEFVLKADDGSGHIALSNAFSVNAPPPAASILVGTPGTAKAPARRTATRSVLDSI